MTTEQNKSPPQHTVGPLWIDDDGFIAAGTGDSYQTIADTRSSPNAVADADFIVLACNSHYQLMAACEAALKDYEQYLPSAATVPSILRAAIAKARGQQ